MGEGWVKVGKSGQYAVKSCLLVNDCELQNLANNAVVYQREALDSATSKCWAVCQQQLSILFLFVDNMKTGDKDNHLQYSLN